MVPEFLSPKVPKAPLPAVAAEESAKGTADGGGSARCLSSEDIAWTYGTSSKAETMHPFWAFRRLTQEQHRKEVGEVIRNNKIKTEVGEPVQKMPAFNLELVDQAQNIVQVATSHSPTLFNYSKQVIIPFLTNSAAVSKGDELILEIAGPKKKDKQPVSQKRFSDLQKNADSQATKRARG